MLGQLLLIANTPSTLLPVSSVPVCASNITGSTPKNGEQHDPGCIVYTYSIQYIHTVLYMFLQCTAHTIHANQSVTQCDMFLECTCFGKQSEL